MSDIKSFISALDGIDKVKTYITEKNGVYSSNSGKKDKNLKTVDVARLAKESFDTIKNDKDLTYSAKVEQFLNLKKALKSYSKRLYRSKSTLQKIGSFFGCKTQFEKDILFYLEQADYKQARYTHKLERVSRALNISKELTNQLEETNNVKLKHFYLGVLDSSSLDCENLNGVHQDGAIAWYLEHLKDFRHNYAAIYSKKELASIDQLILELEKAREKSLGIQRLGVSNKISMRDMWLTRGLENLTGIPLAHIRYFKKAIIHQIQDEIAELKPGQRVLIPGGYSTEKGGHAVLYVIEKPTDNKLSFHVVNTGEGINYAAPIKDTVKNAAKGLWSFWTGKQVNERWTVTDVVYDHLDPKLFNYAFLDELIYKKISGEVDEMKPILDFLKKHFNKSPKNGRVHKAQLKGSCAHKCISATAKGLLDEKIYLSFKVWLTEKEIAKFKNMDLSSELDDILKQKMLDEANELLKKRQVKAS